MIDDLLTTLRRHLDDEQAVLAVLAAADSEVPGVAEPSAANDVWRPDDDTPIRIYVDGLPAEHAFELCIERLLRLLPGQTAELHTDDAQLVAAVSRWLRDFDAAQFGLGHATHGTERLVRVARRRVSTPAAIGYPG